MKNSIIKSHYFSINDKDVLEKILSLKIKYLKCNLECEPNGDLYICAYSPDCNVLETLGRKWSKVITNNGVKIRTPKIMSKYAGNKVICYIDRLSVNKNEVFRIKPIGFSLLENNKIKRKINNIKDPYFTRSGRLVLPRPYLNENINGSLYDITISFELINKLIIEEGFLHAYLVNGFSPSDFVYSIEMTNNSIRTHPVKGVINFLNQMNRSISNYEYIGTLNNNNYKYGIIVFEEIS